MKVLLRKWLDKYYVWHNAEWVGNKYYLVVDGFRMSSCIDSTMILAVAEDNRNNYVVCNNCGEIIENTPEAIEAHYTAEEAKKDCFSCKNLRFLGDAQNEQTTYTKNEDGSYRVAKTFDTQLGCRVNYWTEELESKTVKENCIFYRCRRYGVKPIEDVFVKYPGLFDKQITMDLLQEKKYTFEGYSDGYYIYDLRMRGTLKACVNEMGIVDHFIVFHRGWSSTIYYSNKYNKLFLSDWGKYNPDISEAMNSKKEEQVLEKLASLYKEESTNE